jgi:DinB family protein
MTATDHEHCAVCGFDGAAFDDGALIAALNGLGARWTTLLASAGSDFRCRPAPNVWSAIEYAAHSRDITALHCFGVEQSLTQNEPVYPAIAADDLIETASVGYGAEDPEVVVIALDGEARHVARLVSNTPDGAWQRGLTIGEERMTVRRLLEHALHDSTHHLDDVQRGLEHLRHSSC